MVIGVEAQTKVSIEQVLEWLKNINDPEMPYLSIVDLGIVYEVQWENEADQDELIVKITPTYCGCPATEVIIDTIKKTLENHGVTQFQIKKEISPSWSTKLLTREGKKKLMEQHIITPDGALQCPYCRDTHVALMNEFSSTLCKSLYKCLSCHNLFEKFKCI